MSLKKDLFLSLDRTVFAWDKRYAMCQIYWLRRVKKSRGKELSCNQKLLNYGRSATQAAPRHADTQKYRPAAKSETSASRYCTTRKLSPRICESYQRLHYTCSECLFIYLAAECTLVTMQRYSLPALLRRRFGVDASAQSFEMKGQGVPFCLVYDYHLFFTWIGWII